MKYNNIAEFIQGDLARSGLSLESFPVTPLSSETELMDRLGFKFFGDKRIMDVGGYWIPFPNVPGYYRLKLRGKIGDAKYLSPKNGSNHVYIPEGVERLLKDYTPGEVIGLVEGEKKAQAATDAGVPTIGVSGIWNLNDEDNDFLPELEQYNWTDKVLNITFDSDMTSKPQVKHAELRAAVKFTNRGAKVVSTRLPNEQDGSKNGADDYIVRYGKVKYLELTQQAYSTFELLISENTKAETFIKELLRLDSNIEKERIIKLLSKHIEVPVNVIRTEIQKHETKVEDKPEDEIYTDQEKHNAEELLRGPDILSKMDDLTEKAGYVGEKINKRMLYLSNTSRLMDRGISNEVKGGSASGKSTLVNLGLRLMPKKDVHSYSMLTPKALVHSKFDLSHSILSVQEHHGAEAADYSIRTTLSEQEISILIPIKDEKTGDYKAVEKRIPAVGLVYVETTTQERVHNENQTRVFDLYMDESKEMNRKVIEAMGEAAENPGDVEALEGEFRVWRCAQTLLKPYRVKIPFAKKLAEKFPSDKTRVRRDFLRFLALIETHALLYQYQRETDAQGHLVATLDDLKGILPLAQRVLTQSLKEMSPKQEFVLTIIQQAFKSGERFSIKEVEERMQEVVNWANGAKLGQKDLAQSEANDGGELERKKPYWANGPRELYIQEQIPYRTLRRYIKGFVNDGLLEWNGEKGTASMYSYIISGGPIGQYTIFTPKFLEGLEKSWTNPECPNVDPMAQSESNGSDKNGSIKTVIIDGQLVKLNYDGKVGTIIVERGGKKRVVFDSEPEFQEYLREWRN